MRKAGIFMMIFVLFCFQGSILQAASTEQKDSQVSQSKISDKKKDAPVPQTFGDRLAQLFGKKEAEAPKASSKKIKSSEKSTSKQKEQKEPKEQRDTKWQVVSNGTAMESIPNVMPIPKKIVSKPTVSSFKNTPKPVASPVKSLSKVARTNYVPRSPTPRVALPQIRQEIQRILNINKQIKNVQAGRTAQLQRIQEQGRIHQKILTEIESSQEKTQGNQTISTKNALLAQEKLRIIHEETKRNSEMVNAIRKTFSGKDAAKAEAVSVKKDAKESLSKIKEAVQKEQKKNAGNALIFTSPTGKDEKSKT